MKCSIHSTFTHLRNTLQLLYRLSPCVCLSFALLLIRSFQLLVDCPQRPLGQKLSFLFISLISFPYLLPLSSSNPVHSVSHHFLSVEFISPLMKHTLILSRNHTYSHLCGIQYQSQTLNSSWFEIIEMCFKLVVVTLGKYWMYFVKTPSPISCFNLIILSVRIQQV